MCPQGLSPGLQDHRAPALPAEVATPTRPERLARRVAQEGPPGSRGREEAEVQGVGDGKHQGERSTGGSSPHAPLQVWHCGPCRWRPACSASRSPPPGGQGAAGPPSGAVQPASIAGITCGWAGGTGGVRRYRAPERRKIAAPAHAGALGWRLAAASGPSGAGGARGLRRGRLGGPRRAGGRTDGGAWPEAAAGSGESRVVVSSACCPSHSWIVRTAPPASSRGVAQPGRSGWLPWPGVLPAVRCA